MYHIRICVFDAFTRICASRLFGLCYLCFGVCVCVIIQWAIPEDHWELGVNNLTLGMSVNLHPDVTLRKTELPE